MVKRKQIQLPMQSGREVKMPCNSDYLNANHMEVAISKVYCLLDELDGNGGPSGSSWYGYHPRVYSKHLTKEQCDSLVAELCGRLQELDVTEYSLEMQMWWRDHQRADARRVEKELKEAKDAAAYEAAVAKLTPYELSLIKKMKK